MLEILPPTLNLVGALLLAAFVLWDEAKVERFLASCLGTVGKYFSDTLELKQVTPTFVIRKTVLYGLSSIAIFGGLWLAHAAFFGRPGIGAAVIFVLLFLSLLSFALNLVMFAILVVIRYANHDRQRERRLGFIGAALLCLGYAVDIWLRI